MQNTMQKNFLMRCLNLLCSNSPSFNAHKPNYKTPSLVSFHFHNLYTTKSESNSENPNSHHPENEIQNGNRNPVDVEDVSSEDLKTQIDKFYKGDFDAIPTIFESILKRKLAGKHDESDDELMNEFRQQQPNKISDEELDSDSDTASDCDK